MKKIIEEQLDDIKAFMDKKLNEDELQFIRDCLIITFLEGKEKGLKNAAH